MANPTVSLVSYIPPVHGGSGSIIVDLTWTTYAQNADVLDLSGLISRLPNFDPADIKMGDGVVPATGDGITFAPAGSPTTSNLGVLRSFSGATQKTAGAYAVTARFSAALTRPLPF